MEEEGPSYVLKDNFPLRLIPFALILLFHRPAALPTAWVCLGGLLPLHLGYMLAMWCRTIAQAKNAN